MSSSLLPSQPSHALSVTVAPLAVRLAPVTTCNFLRQSPATCRWRLAMESCPGQQARPRSIAQKNRTRAPSIQSPRPPELFGRLMGSQEATQLWARSSANGLYRSPLILPSPNAVNVTATSVAIPSVSQTALLTLYNPIPTVSSVTPSKVSVGAFTLTVSGQSFMEGAQVLFAGNPLPTTFTSSKQLVATGVATQTGNVQVQVRNPQPGSASSAAVLTVQVTAPPPVATPPTGPQTSVIAVVTPAKVSTTVLERLNNSLLPSREHQTRLWPGRCQELAAAEQLAEQSLRAGSTPPQRRNQRLPLSPLRQPASRSHLDLHLPRQQLCLLKQRATSSSGKTILDRWTFARRILTAIGIPRAQRFGVSRIQVQESLQTRLVLTSI